MAIPQFPPRKNNRGPLGLRAIKLRERGYDRTRLISLDPVSVEKVIKLKRLGRHKSLGRWETFPFPTPNMGFAHMFPCGTPVQPLPLTDLLATHPRRLLTAGLLLSFASGILDSPGHYGHGYAWVCLGLP